jgi:hypothetical protein
MSTEKYFSYKCYYKLNILYVYAFFKRIIKILCIIILKYKKEDVPNLNLQRL